MVQNNPSEEIPAPLKAIISVNDGNILKTLDYLLCDNERKDEKIKKMISETKKKERQQHTIDKRLFTKVFHESLLSLVKSNKLSFADLGFILSCIPLLSKTGNALIDVETETVIKTVKKLAKNLNQSPRTTEARIKSLEKSGTDLFKRTSEGYFLDTRKIYFTRQAPKPIPLTEEEKYEVEQIYQDIMWHNYRVLTAY